MTFVTAVSLPPKARDAVDGDEDGDERHRHARGRGLGVDPEAGVAEAGEDCVGQHGGAQVVVLVPPEGEAGGGVVPPAGDEGVRLHVVARQGHVPLRHLAGGLARQLHRRPVVPVLVVRPVQLNLRRRSRVRSSVSKIASAPPKNEPAERRRRARRGEGSIQF